MSNEIIIKTENVDICADSFGNPDNPAVLLIMGAMASMMWWDSDFCEKLASRGRFVIRFDNRDTGRSTFYEPGIIAYDVEDMADDALRVLDFYNINKAHIAGMSLGGMLAQLLAIKYPERVLSITIIASGVWDDLPDLPSIDNKILQHHKEAVTLNWSDENEVIDYSLKGLRLLNGRKNDFDEKRNKILASTEFKRAGNYRSMFNHAFLKGGESYYGRSSEITHPVLIIHGTEDPVLPFKHAEVLKNTIPHAKLLTLEGAGHELHENNWEAIIKAITDL